MDTTDPTIVIVGAGLAGLATAVAAVERGHRVVVLEKADQVGGAASFSGGQVWIAANHLEEAEGIDDRIEDGEAYVRAVGASHPELIDDAALHRWLREAPRAAAHFEALGAVRWRIIPDYPDYYQDAPGARATGRYLTATYDASRLGAWRDRLRVSPHFPVGTTYDELLTAGLRASAFGTAAPEVDGVDREDLLSFGTGVVAGFLGAAVDRGVDIRTGHAVIELTTDGAGRVTGVVALDPDGERVTLEGAVVLATSGYDWDDVLAKEYLGLDPEERGSVAPESISGDGIRLARSVGGTVDEIPRNRVPIQVGYATGGDPAYAVAREHSLPHTFVVDRSGRRFCDDAVYWEIVKAALVEGSPHRPCYMIWDAQHHRRYGLGTTSPGGTYPDGLVTTADDLEELGARLGIDGAELARTAEAFNADVAEGVDRAFARGSNTTWQRFQGDPAHLPHPNLGPVVEPPFHGMRLRMVSTGIGLTGIAVDEVGRVLDAHRRPVPGLYAAGAAAAFRSSGTAYNSGFSLSRAITLGLLVAEHVAVDHR